MRDGKYKTCSSDGDPIGKEMPDVCDLVSQKRQQER
jgi:hypothetical protein